MTRIIVVAAASIFLYGCGAVGGQAAAGSSGDTNGGGSKASLPEGPPGIAGVVTELRRDSSEEATSLVTILVEENPGQGKPVGCSRGSSKQRCNKLLLSITEQTSILREVGDEELVRATGADLARNQRVRAWHEDVVTRSYPGQTRARVVVIEEAG